MLIGKYTSKKPINTVVESELHFEKLQSQTLYDALSEIETLTEENIIKEIIKITKQRYELDKIIHAKQLFDLK